MKTIPHIALLITSLMCSGFLYAGDNKNQAHENKHSSHKAHNSMSSSGKKINENEQHRSHRERSGAMRDDEAMDSGNIHKHPSAQDRLRDKD